MSLAAVKNDAMAIRKRLLAKKQPVALHAPPRLRLPPSRWVGLSRPPTLVM